MNAALLPDAALDKLANMADVQARAVVEKVLAELPYVDPPDHVQTARAKAFPALVGKISGSEAGDAVDQFLAAGDLIDKRIDADLVSHAQAFFEENGISIITALFHAALPEAYLGRRGVQVLGMTGELVTNWMRRIQLTGQLLVTVLTHDADLDAGVTTLDHGQVAARAVRRVRLRHAAVRWLLESPYEPQFKTLSLEYLEEDLGEHIATLWDLRMKQIDEPVGTSRPLNQEDLLGTLGTFTTVTFGALAKMGVQFDEKDREAYYHLWNIVGWHLGIGDETTLGKGFKTGAGTDRWPGNLIFPLAPPDMDAVFGRLRHRLQGRTDEGLRLAKTLVQEMSRPLPGPLQGAPSFLVRYLIGDELADELEIDGGGYLQLLVRRSGALETVAKRLRVNPVGEIMVSALSSAITRYALRAFVAQSSGTDPGFTIDPGIANRWGVQTGPELTAPLRP